MTEILFTTGEVVATAGLMALDLPQQTLFDLVARHVRGDWGDLEDDDKAANDSGLNPTDPDRLVSAYDVEHHGKTVRVNIITEHDRSLTTLMLPEDY